MTISTKIYWMGFSKSVKKTCLILTYLSLSVIIGLNNDVRWSCSAVNIPIKANVQNVISLDYKSLLKVDVV